MTITNGYCTKEELAGYLRNIDDYKYSDALEDAINAASRQVDAYCSRRFYLDVSATARTFWTYNDRLVLIDDAASITSVKLSSSDNGTYDQTRTDYTPEPLNGKGSGMEGLPTWRLRFHTPVLPTKTETPCVQVTATWGWAAVPAPVKQACLILATEAFKLSEAPFGVAGFGDMGVVRVGRMSPKAADMLDPYRADVASFA